MIDQALIQDIHRLGSRRSDGNGRLITHLRGERLNAIEAISAKCADCQGWYQDGGDPDCHQPGCPLYPHYAWLLKRDPIGRPRKRVEPSGRSKSRIFSAAGESPEPVPEGTGTQSRWAAPHGGRSRGAADPQRRTSPFAATGRSDSARPFRSNR